MPFLPALSGHYRALSGAACRLYIGRAGQNREYRSLTFVFSRELVEQAGWQGGERFVVSLGVDEDLGAFQISRVTRARTGLKLLSHSNARGFRLHLRLPPVIHGIRPAEFLDRLGAPVNLDHTLNGASLVVRAPLAEVVSEPASIEPRVIGLHEYDGQRWNRAQGGAA